jgi:hypothetical protein
MRIATKAIQSSLYLIVYESIEASSAGIFVVYEMCLARLM